MSAHFGGHWSQENDSMLLYYKYIQHAVLKCIIVPTHISQRSSLLPRDKFGHGPAVRNSGVQYLGDKGSVAS